MYFIIIVSWCLSFHKKVIVVSNDRHHFLLYFRPEIGQLWNGLWLDFQSYDMHTMSYSSLYNFFISTIFYVKLSTGILPMQAVPILFPHLNLEYDL